MVEKIKRKGLDTRYHCVLLTIDLFCQETTHAKDFWRPFSILFISKYNEHTIQLHNIATMMSPMAIWLIFRGVTGPVAHVLNPKDLTHKSSSLAISSTDNCIPSNCDRVLRRSLHRPVQLLLMRIYTVSPKTLFRKMRSDCSGKWHFKQGQH